jgi:hypothetical protein
VKDPVDKSKKFVNLNPGSQREGFHLNFLILDFPDHLPVLMKIDSQVKSLRLQKHFKTTRSCFSLKKLLFFKSLNYFLFVILSASKDLMLRLDVRSDEILRGDYPALNAGLRMTGTD